MTDRLPVKSSNIVSVGYSPAEQELHVEFKSGGVYTYHGVSPDEHKALIEADSIGSHFHNYIRPSFKVTKQ